jgi:hypothetical protein
MANQIFDPGREGFAKGEIVWTSTPTLKVSLVRGYTFDITDKFVSEVTAAGGTLHATATLGTISATNGVCDAADTTFTTPSANANNHYLLIYQASAVGGGADVAAASQRLICYIDTATGLTSLQPNGANIVIAWDNGANKIFKL